MIGMVAGIVAAGLLVGVYAAFFRFEVVRLYRARQHLQQGATLVDVDPPDEFFHRHPHAAVNIPLEQLAPRAHEIGGAEQPIVVYAHHWWRGKRAERELRGMGFHDVFNAAGARIREDVSEVASQIAEAREQSDDFELVPGEPPEERRAEELRS